MGNNAKDKAIQEIGKEFEGKKIAISGWNLCAGIKINLLEIEKYQNVIAYEMAMKRIQDDIDCLIKYHLA